MSTDPSLLVPRPTDRRITSGEIVRFVAAPGDPPKITEAELKKPSEYRLVGRRDIGRLDVPSKVNGTARYGIDVQVPGMVYATIVQSPMDGAKAESVNTDEVMKVKGVQRVLALPFGVAVVGDTVEATHRGRVALNIKWNLAE